MKTVLGLLAILAAGSLAAGPAFAQQMSPEPVTTGSTAAAPLSPPLSSRTLLSQAFDPYFPPAANAAATPAAGSMQAPAMEAPAMAAPVGEGTPPEGAAAKLVSYSSAHVDGPYIAITFDDGPNPETTPKLLKLLKQRGIHATFFVLGSRAAQSPEILRQMVAEGHEIGNHSWSHPQLPKISVAEADKQIETTSAAIEKATGQRPIYLRPPYGEMTASLRDHLNKKYGLTFVYWSVDTLDWKNRNTQKIYDRAMKEVGRGGIILAHDIHATTVDAMPKLLDALLAKGYKFVTISQLIAMNKPQEKVASLTPTQPKKPKATGTSASKKSTKSSAKPASSKSTSSGSGSSKPASSKSRTSGLY